MYFRLTLDGSQYLIIPLHESGLIQTGFSDLWVWLVSRSCVASRSALATGLGLWTGKKTLSRKARRADRSPRHLGQSPSATRVDLAGL